MNWLTPEQVKKAATTPAKALDVSILHWEQIVAANKAAIKEHGKTLLSSQHCGLCSFYYGDADCGECPLGECVGGRWNKVANHWFDFLEGWNPDPAYRRFKYHAKKMLKLLRELKQKGSK